MKFTRIIKTFSAVTTSQIRTAAKSILAVKNYLQVVQTEFQERL